MKFFLSLTLLVLGTKQIAAICYPNTVCPEERDTITHLHAAVLPTERNATGMGSRTWYIPPKDEPFNVILAFKNFSSTLGTEVQVITYEGENKTDTHHLSGELGNFEIVLRDTNGVIIFVQLNLNETTDFVLHYYSGCEVLSSSQDQINYQDPRQVSFTQKKCWLIHPADNTQRRRVYFSIREVILNPGYEIAIWDVHTSHLIAKALNDDDERLVAAEPRDYAVILVDLICTRNTTCRSDSNSLFLSYYAMTQADLACMSTQRECYERPVTPELNCNATCPAFDNMVLEEYGLQINANVTPIVRAGSRSVNANRNRGTKSQCPWERRFCNCLRNNPRPTEYYCRASVRCFSRGFLDFFLVQFAAC